MRDVWGRDTQYTRVINLAWDEAAHPRAKKGTPEGGQFVAAGKARNAEAAKAQKDTKAADNYKKVQQAKDQAKFAKDLSDADLEAMTRYLYSFKSSDPKIVKARIAAANELARRGKNVNDFGGLGKKTPVKAPAKAPAKKTTAVKK